MQIDIQSRGFALTHALREYTRRRLRFALTRAADRVRRINTPPMEKEGSSCLGGPMDFD